MTKTLNLTIFVAILVASCGQSMETPDEITSSVDSAMVIESRGKEEDEPDTREIRKEYVANYSKIQKIDTVFENPEGKIIHIRTVYYCLFDSAVVVPKQYVWEDTSTTFTTHNYSHDILIVIDQDTVFNKTITKADFADELYPELKSYAILLYPDFHYDREKRLFNFSYSLSIPITDVGEGWRILIDEKGNIVKTDR